MGILRARHDPISQRRRVLNPAKNGFCGDGEAPRGKLSDFALHRNRLRRPHFCHGAVYKGDLNGDGVMGSCCFQRLGRFNGSMPRYCRAVGGVACASSQPYEPISNQPCRNLAS